MEQQDNSSLEAENPKSRSNSHGLTKGEGDIAPITRTDVLQGRLLGDQRVRTIYASHSSLRKVQDGIFEATPATEVPRGGFGRLSYTVKRFLIGAPIATAQAEHERLTKVKALAVLSSDAISSVAYATEEILVVIIAAGSLALSLAVPISLAIILLLAIVAISYRQTIPAYPNGGGSYIVAKDNLGTLAGLIAAGSLLIDYVLTVSVSVASGVQNLASLLPSLSSYVVLIDVVLVVFITVVNLRGVRESGSIFAIPTYIFIFSALFLILVGGIKGFFFEHHAVIGHFKYVQATEGLSLFLILKAFASGCSAMTGVEAISNGIPAFKKPETRNAAITLTWMALILGVLFIGITLLATSYGVEAYQSGNPTVIAQIAQLVFTGPLFFMFPIFQISTLFILTLAANTSYSDFPRLASLLARDHFLPHQFAFRGDRLAFSIGIGFLAILASLLLIIFKGDVSLLINLYAVGVFMSFTLSQGGMVRHWWKLRGEHQGWQRSLMINGLGAITTLLVAVIIASTKFLEGAWIVVILIPLLVLMFELIHHHYTRVEQERTTDIPIQPQNVQHRVVVPVAGLDVITKQAVSFARSITKQVVALHISSHKEKTDALLAAWEQWQQELDENEQCSLVVVELEQSTVSSRILSYLDTLHQQHPQEIVTVVLPEVSVLHWWEYFSRNSVAIRLKASLLFRPGIVVTDISPYKQLSPSVPQRLETAAIPLHASQVKHLFIVPIAGLDKVSKQSLAYARSISNRVVAVHVSIDAHEEEQVRHDWDAWKHNLSPDENTELVVIESPFRSLSRPLLDYIDAMRELYPDYALNVLLPEFVVAHWWEHILHNQTALQLKAALLFREHIIVTSVPQHLPSAARAQSTLQPIVPM